MALNRSRLGSPESRRNFFERQRHLLPPGDGQTPTPTDPDLENGVAQRWEPEIALRLVTVGLLRRGLFSSFEDVSVKSNTEAIAKINFWV